MFTIRDAAAAAFVYRRVPLRALLAPARGAALLAAGWLLLTAASIVLGVASVAYQWSGLPLHFGGADLYVTIYPPLVLCTLAMFWFGFWWGAVPAYLATLVLALQAGMPAGWAALFAFADPLGFVVLATVYRSVRMPYAPRTLEAAFFFTVVSFIAAVFSAAGSFVWSGTMSSGMQGAYAIWQGWWVGAFVQTVFICGPVLALASPAVVAWRDRHLAVAEPSLPARGQLLATSATGVGGVLAFLWVSLLLSRRSLEGAAAADGAGWRRLLETSVDASTAVYWVMTVVIVAIVFLGHRFFEHWAAELERAAAQAATERDLALQRQHEAERAHRKLAEAHRELGVHMEEIQRLQARLAEQALRDPLTGLHNRRHLYEQLAVELQRAQRQNTPLCVAVIDVDHFKAVNDEHGHAAGDLALKALAELLRSQVRSMDLACRLGGEEFCLVLVNTSLGHAVERVSELQRRCRERVLEVAGRHIGRLTFSAGVAAYPSHGTTGDALLREADLALYRAKHEGRDRVVVAAPPGGTVEAAE